MSAPKMKVKCSVSNCKFYKSNYCTAKELEINPMGDGHAESSDGTCCTTFIPNSH